MNLFETLIQRGGDARSEPSIDPSLYASKISSISSDGVSETPSIYEKQLDMFLGADRTFNDIRSENLGSNPTAIAQNPTFLRGVEGNSRFDGI